MHVIHKFRISAVLVSGLFLSGLTTDAQAFSPSHYNSSFNYKRSSVELIDQLKIIKLSQIQQSEVKISNNANFFDVLISAAENSSVSIERIFVLNCPLFSHASSANVHSQRVFAVHPDYEGQMVILATPALLLSIGRQLHLQQFHEYNAPLSINAEDFDQAARRWEKYQRYPLFGKWLFKTTLDDQLVHLLPLLTSADAGLMDSAQVAAAATVRCVEASLPLLEEIVEVSLQTGEGNLEKLNQVAGERLSSLVPTCLH